jgi:hypothetical protein
MLTPFPYFLITIDVKVLAVDKTIGHANHFSM